MHFLLKTTGETGNFTHKKGVWEGLCTRIGFEATRDCGIASEYMQDHEGVNDPWRVVIRMGDKHRKIGISTRRWFSV